MRHTRTPWRGIALALALSGGAAHAQDAPPPAAEPPAAEAQEAPVQEQVDAVLERYDEAYEEFNKAWGAAETDEERQRAFEESYPDGDAFAAELMAIAEVHPKDPAVAEAYEWILRNASDREVQTRAARGLVRDFADRDGLGLSLRSLPPVPASLEVLREAAKSEHAQLAGSATFTLGTKLLEQVRYANMVEGMEAAQRASFEEYLGAEGFAALMAADPAALEHEAEVLLERVVETPEWAAIDYYSNGTLGAKAEAALFELHHLAVGQPVPEIEGEDIDAVAFKLSDYRGKVVFLDFWGNW
jgi:hypothetical protein